ncbi:MAG TPA: tetratricopeptide repeat protein [Vicinamibacterales bacterium]|nr:tetratricopeptide repeat protein [Vicinamibacterales bacterium]
MKAQERRHLKENEFAITTRRVVETLQANRDRAVIAAAAIVVVLVIGGGWAYWHKYTSDESGALLGVAMSVAQAPIVPPPTVPGATQSPGTYPSDQARQEAAVQAFQQVVTQYPNTPAGLTARYQLAVALLTLGRLPEAEQAFTTAASQAGSSIYGPMARLGRAEALRAQNKYDDAIKAFTDLAAERDSVLPVDGVLMQLAETCLKAGKTQEARAAFKRVVDEFPDSGYSTEARQQLAALG